MTSLALPPALSNLKVFLAFDYSQLEIRMLAEVSQDPLLIAQLNEGRDIHCLVGNLLTGATFEEIKADKELRKSIKEFHFSLVYGVSKASMHGHLVGKGLRVTKQQADQYFDRYFEQYKGVARFMEKMRKFGELHKYVETMFGFRRQIMIKDDRRGTYWGNQVVNTPIQGAAHQLLLIAMALLKMRPQTYALLHWRDRLLAEVHDALFFRIPLYQLIEAFQVGAKLLQHDVVAYAASHFKRKIRVPMLAEAEAGFTMGTMVPYEGEPIPVFLEKWYAKLQDIESRPLTRLFKEDKFKG